VSRWHWPVEHRENPFVGLGRVFGLGAAVAGLVQPGKTVARIAHPPGFRSRQPVSCAGSSLRLKGKGMNEVILPDELTPQDRMKAFREEPAGHLRPQSFGRMRAFTYAARCPPLAV
jgi:hypothetical protein